MAPLVACYGPEYDSVHFNSARPDFLQMPPPWWQWPGEVRALETHELSRYGYPYEGTSGPGKAPPPPLWVTLKKRAVQQEQAGRFRPAAATWEAYERVLEQARADPYLGNSYQSDAIPDQNASKGLADRVLALRAWRGAPDTTALKSYLKARDLVDQTRFAEATTLLSQIRGEPYGAHADYLRAAIRFYTGFYTQTPEFTAEVFRAVAGRHPRFAPASYMVGRCSLAPVLADERGYATASPPVFPNYVPAQRETYLRRALAAYDACAAADPKGPLAEEARGMAAACRYRLRDYPPALLHYCRHLAALPPGRDDTGVFVSARKCLKAMSLADHRAFQAKALMEPATAAVYLDFHLHYGRLAARGNYNLGMFALEVLKRDSHAPLSGRLLSRLALIEDRAGRPARAEKLASRALRRLPPGAEQDNARWARAQSLEHLKREREALAEWERLAGTAGVPKMRRGAREAAAVVSERLHDYPNAIRHYFALQYVLDYGYVVDCLASQDDLRAFLKRFPGHPQAKLIRYSLGFRQLRAGQYEAAAKTFESLGPWLDVAEKKFACKTYREQPRWPPLRTARFLAEASRRVAAARTEGEKARIAYGMGQLMFRQRHLLFYNGALWVGARTGALQLSGPATNLEDPQAALSEREQRAMDRYQEEHTALYQALRVFERVAERYPRTPEAPRALYSAALCYTILPGVESYWDSTRKINYTARASALYRRLQREYPHDPLAAAAAKWGGALSARKGGKP
jgi:tetratricopeptide (TPR) repeat protein